MSSNPSSVFSFYTNEGWQSDSSGSSLDSVLFEDLRSCSNSYLFNNRRRLQEYFPSTGDYILDCASGPIQYPEYLSYSSGFSKRVCVDLSSDALNRALSLDPDKVIPVEGDIRSLDLSMFSFDVILSLHTIYHLPLSDQFPVINKFISLLSPRGMLLIVYSNPNFLLERLKTFIKFVLHRKKAPIFTFERFQPSQVLSCYPSAKLIPYRFLSGEDMKRIFPNNKFTLVFLRLLSFVEPFLPLFLCQYYIIKVSKN